MNAYDTDDIKAQYSVSSIVGSLIKLERDGQEFKACCPFHKERSPSFHVVDAKGFYHCFGCGAHGDVVDFVAAYYNVPFKEACRIITGQEPAPSVDRAQRASLAINYYEGMTPLPAPAAAQELWVAGRQTPQIFNPKRADDEKKRTVRYTPSMVFPYRDMAGLLLGYVLRVEFSAREGDAKPTKITPTIRFATLPDGKQGWTHWHFDEPRPLYGLELLAETPLTSQIFICEGEKAADACRRLLGVVAVTWPGGTNAVDVVDWSPLAGRKVVIWPDADEGGWKAGQAIAALLHPICTGVKLIDPRDHPTKGWDIADAEAEGMSRADALAWGKARISEWTPEPQPTTSKPKLAAKKQPKTEPAPATPPAASSEPPPISDDEIASIMSRGDEEPQDTRSKWEPFRILGYNKGTYYYMPRGTQQLTELPAASHTKANLLTLAPMEYWENQYPKKGGFDLDMAMNALMQSAAKVGIFVPERLRGRGAWVDAGRAVVHLGPQVHIAGVPHRPTDVTSEYIYEAAPPLSIKPEIPATTAEAHRLVEICDRLTWENPLSAQMLAGWCVIAPVCGALDWRSHIWVTGSAGTGKSTVMKRIIGQVVGPVALYVEGSTTEAGLRQSLQHDARPVIFDEAESEDRQSAVAMQKVLGLARIGSSGGEVVKGGQEGQAKSYSVRSCFCFSSINTAVAHHADETRISKLVLRKNDRADREQHYRELMRDVSAWMTPDYAAKMFARSIENITTLLANARVFTDAVDAVVGNRRAADQIGPMIAGLFLCHSTKAVNFEQAVEWIRARNWTDHMALEGGNDERKLLTTIMMHRVRINLDPGGAREVTLGELCLHLSGHSHIMHLGTDDARRELGRNGLKYDQDTESVIIANRAPTLSTILENTPWSKDWMRPLRSLPHAAPANSEYFSAGLTQKGTRVPIVLLGE